jgi:hypothetical protein
MRCQMLNDFDNCIQRHIWTFLKHNGHQKEWKSFFLLNTDVSAASDLASIIKGNNTYIKVITNLYISIIACIKVSDHFYISIIAFI